MNGAWFYKPEGLRHAGGVTVCLAAFAETQLRCRKRSCAQLVQLRAANAASASRAPIRSTIGSIKAQWTIYWTQVTQQAQPAQPAQPAQLVQLRAANAASAARAPIRSTIGSMGPQKPNEQYIERRWRSRRSQHSSAAGAANAANAASASRAPIRSTIGGMGPQKPNEQYIERRWRSRRSQRSQRSQRSWCSCAQPAQPELQFEVL